LDDSGSATVIFEEELDSGTANWNKVLILKEKLGVLVSRLNINWEVRVAKFFDEGKWLFFGFIIVFLCLVPLG